MEKTTVYLPRALKAALKRLARQRKCSEAAVLMSVVKLWFATGMPR